MELHQPNETQQPNSAEAEIRKLIKEFRAAAMARDVDKLMTFYADEIVAFDVIPPVQYVGKKSYRKSWEEAFESCKDDPSAMSESVELSITADDNLAFCHSLNHNVMVSNDGQKLKMWLRATNCFKKIDGKWLIVHEQFSVPIDFESGKALFNLGPSSSFH